MRFSSTASYKTQIKRIPPVVVKLYKAPSILLKGGSAPAFAGAGYLPFGNLPTWTKRLDLRLWESFPGAAGFSRIVCSLYGSIRWLCVWIGKEAGSKASGWTGEAILGFGRKSFFTPRVCFAIKGEQKKGESPENKGIQWKARVPCGWNCAQKRTFRFWNHYLYGRGRHWQNEGQEKYRFTGASQKYSRYWADSAGLHGYVPRGDAARCAPFADAIRKVLPGAEIVLDRFHIMKLLNIAKHPLGGKAG